MPTREEARQMFEACERFLPGYPPRSEAEEYAALLAWVKEHGPVRDVYGQGGAVAVLEERIAALLGKPAAVFAPSGTLLQPAALRLWAERAGRPQVAFHPTSHLELHEHRAYSRLHGLEATLLGDARRPTLRADLEGLAEVPAALLIELPLREIGGQLPAWEELEELQAAARERDVRLHCDGARLWEAAAGFGRSPAEVAAGFDSVYVSLYKGIGGITGAALAGPEDFVAALRLWIRRSGGNLVRSDPFAVSALRQLDARLALMPRLVERARELAAALDALPRLRIRPTPPQVNMFHLYLDGPLDTLKEARDALAREERIWLFGGLHPADVPGFCRSEVYVGGGALEFPPDQAAAAFARLLARA